MKDYKKIVKNILFEVMIVLMEENLGKKIDIKNFTNDDFRTFTSIESLMERV